MVNYRISDGIHAKGYKVFRDGDIVVPNHVYGEIQELDKELVKLQEARQLFEQLATDRQADLHRRRSDWWDRRERDLNIPDLRGQYALSGCTLSKYK